MIWLNSKNLALTSITSRYLNNLIKKSQLDVNIPCIIFSAGNSFLACDFRVISKLKLDTTKIQKTLPSAKNLRFIFK